MTFNITLGVAFYNQGFIYLKKINNIIMNALKFTLVKYGFNSLS